MDRSTRKILFTAGAVALGLVALGFSACSTNTIPKGVTAVQSFDLNKYLGSWYEIARFDFRFERGLERVTATYTLDDNGTIGVLNRGYNPEKETWKTAEGKAKRVGSDSAGMLKVSFFGPFYAGYNVIAIDPDYKYALVAGESREYLWILSREKTIPASIKRDYLAKAEGLGFATEKLLWVPQS